MINRSASSLPVSTAGSCGQGSRFVRKALALVVPLALALGGCGNKATDAATEARLQALEKKIDAADKRSHQAISMVMQPNSPPPADNGDIPVFDDAPIEPYPESFDGEDQDGIPASPAIGTEG